MSTYFNNIYWTLLVQVSGQVLWYCHLFTFYSIEQQVKRVIFIYIVGAIVCWERIDRHSPPIGFEVTFQSDYSAAVTTSSPSKPL